jgi:hypothetical protein
MIEAVLAIAGFLGLPIATPATPEPRIEVWAGHQVLAGKRKVPLYGDKDIHTEIYLVAEVHRSPGHIELIQKICRMDISPIKNVLASMKPETVQRMPKSRFSLDEKPDGSLTGPPWRSGWDDEDLDGDGHPGATVQISGSSCSGEIYVSNQSTSTLTSGHASDGGMTGQLSVRTQQRILGASGFCLKLVAGDSDEAQTGWFSYRRVRPDDSCRALSAKPWPVKAQGAK